MKSIDRREAESSLGRKGFICDEKRDHHFWYFWYKGKRTIVRTKVSTGTKYKTLGHDILNAMKQQLQLDTLSDVKDLLKCPIDLDQYIQILLLKGKIKDR